MQSRDEGQSLTAVSSHGCSCGVGQTGAHPRTMANVSPWPPSPPQCPSASSLQRSAKAHDSSHFLRRCKELNNERISTHCTPQGLSLSWHPNNTGEAAEKAQASWIWHIHRNRGRKMRQHKECRPNGPNATDRLKKLKDDQPMKPMWSFLARRAV